MLKFCTAKNFRRRAGERAMEFTTSAPAAPRVGSAFSVVSVERALRQARTLDLGADWAQLPLGHPYGRRTAYRPGQRIAAVLAGLAAGLNGIALGNSLLRLNSAPLARRGGRFPDQGTIRRWLDQVTAPAGGRPARPPPSDGPGPWSLLGGPVLRALPGGGCRWPRLGARSALRAGGGGPPGRRPGSGLPALRGLRRRHVRGARRVPDPGQPDADEPTARGAGRAGRCPAPGITRPGRAVCRSG